MKKLLLFMMMLITSIASWAEDPYFEVVSGSFASGNVTVKFTFPEATTVEVTGSIYLDHSDKPSGAITAYGPAVSTEGNTVTATFTYTPWAGIGEKGFSFWSGSITATGYSQYTNIYAKPEPPYATIKSGSLESGSATVTVTFPDASTVTTQGYSFYYVMFYYNDNQIAQVGTDNITTVGNTFDVAFTFTPQGGTLANYSVKIEQYAIKIDGNFNGDELIIPFSTPTPSGCEHTNCTSHPAVEPTGSTPGNIAYVQCNDCNKYFAADDVNHENPIKWKDIEIAKLCDHELVGADDICLNCGQILPHKSRLPMTWTLGGVTATYNPVEKSLEFSGNGEIPICDNNFDVDALKAFYPWYAVLNLTEKQIDEYSTQYVCDPLNKIIIGDGITCDNSNLNVCTSFLSASVIIDHSTKLSSDTEWYFNSKDLLVLENDDAKVAYKYNPMYYYNSMVMTQADLASQGISSFPAPSLRDNCRHTLEQKILPVCNSGVDNILYCYVCGLAKAPTTDGYGGYYDLSDTHSSHSYGAAHTCTRRIHPNPACGKKDPAYCSHTNITEYDAVATTQQNPGHIAFVKCSDCDSYFAATDASHATALDFETQVLIAQLDPSCTHELFVNGVCSSCGYACAHPVSAEKTPKCTGIHATYFRCEVCGLAFEDAACQTRISEFDLSHKFPTSDYDYECEHGCGKWNPAKCYHPWDNRVLHEYAEPTCTEFGLYRHYECTKCDALLDYDNYSVTTLDALKIDATGHNFNYYGVCSNCGLEGSEATDCPYNHSYYTEVGDSRTSCIEGLGPQHTIYYRCNVCNRYLKWYDGEMTQITKSDMNITPAAQLHNGHLVRHDACDPTCTEPGYKSYKECTDCHRKYYSYTPDSECNLLSDNPYFIHDVTFDQNYVVGEPLGHAIDPVSNKCTRCEFAPTYRKVMANSQIKRGAYYIIVSKIGSQYYALGKPKDAEFRSFLEGYDAVPVNVNPDGTITVTDSKVSQLFTLGEPGITFYSPKYGMIGLESGQLMSQLRSFITLGTEQSIPISYGDWDCNVMRLSVANDKKVVWTKEGERVDVKYPHTEIEPGSLVWAFAGAGITGSFNPARMEIFREVFLGEKGGEKTFVFNGANSVSTHIKSVDENGFDNYHTSFLYVLDTEVLLNTEDLAASISGPATSDDVDNFIAKAEEGGKKYASIDLRNARGISKEDVAKVKESSCVTSSTVILLPDNFDISGLKTVNLVVGSVCEAMEILDKADIDIPAMFTASHISYSRAMSGTSQWGTLCMPFAVESNDDVQLYELSKVSNNKDDEGDKDAYGVLTFTAIDRAAPGQPVVFRKNNKDAAGITIAMDNAEMKSGESETVNTDIDKWVIKGTLKGTIIKSGTVVTEYDEIHETVVSSMDVNRYYIASDKFWNAKKEAIVPAFRAWFECDVTPEETDEEPAAVKSTYTIFIMDNDDNVTAVLNPVAEGELEECTEIYDLSGKKLTAPVKGQVNIINGKKIFVK